MRTPPFDPNARRKAVGIKRNQVLATRASVTGLTFSRLVEESIARGHTEIVEERIRAELRDAGERTSAYVARYGRPFEDWTSEDGADTDADHTA